MIALDSLAHKAVAIGKFFDAEVAIFPDALRLQKKRSVIMRRRPDIQVSMTMNLNVSFEIIDDERETVNNAVVYLLPEELSVFTNALVRHPILLPISYSQQLSMERGMYCLQLTSKESPENFAERLSKAIGVLE